MRTTNTLLLSAALLLVSSANLFAERYVAFSLREANRLAQSSDPLPAQLSSIGEITRVVGLVEESKTDDLVLVGAALEELPPIAFDELVTAFRARMVHQVWPMVSIDSTPGTYDPGSKSFGKQVVRFRGPLAGTLYGKNLLQQDILLKMCSLERLKIEPSADRELKSYKALRVEHAIKHLQANGSQVVSERWLTPDNTASELEALQDHRLLQRHSYQHRFWFHAEKPDNTPAEGAFCIDELKVVVQEELVEDFAAPGETSEAASAPAHIIAPAEQFSRSFSENLSLAARSYPKLLKLKALYDLVAVAEAVRQTQCDLDIDFFLDEYPLQSVSTPETIDLIDLCCRLDTSDGSRHLIRISGGIEVHPDIGWLNEGDVTVLTKIVTESRPRQDALSWDVPLHGWEMPNAQDLRGLVHGSGGRQFLRGTPPGANFFSQTFELAPPGLGNFPKARTFEEFAPRPVNGVFVNPRPERDPTPLDKYVVDQILGTRPSDKAVHWEGTLRLEDIEDE